MRNGNISVQDKLKDLLEYVKAEGRICPNPQEWNALWEMLPDKEQGSSGWEPPVPLILSAWWDSPYLEKILRLDIHIHYAVAHGMLDEIDTYLRGLLPDQWFYGFK
jgi:hypothetical protein